MNMKKLICYTVLLLMGYGLQAQKIPGLLTVPENVKKNASVITHYDDMIFEVTDLDRASLTVHKSFTIVNETGKAFLSFVVPTSRYSSLEDAEIKVFDMLGRQVQRVKKKDMRTVANGEGLIDDGYMTYYQVSVPSFPVTLEITYERKYKGTLWYPVFSIAGSGEGVERASCIVKVPKELDLRYKERNTTIKPVITEEGKYKIYKWSAQNLPPVEYEEGGPGSRYPAILLAPNQFSLYGYNGDLTTWKNFGLFNNGLYKGLDDLPEARKAFFRNLVKNIPGEEEKIKAIYSYLQHNFRYVSIQLGIGGFKPFSAEFTDTKKYGDCKGLSNFMKAALKAVGIKSYVALINAAYDDEPLDPSFPSSMFNHAILCIPRGNDTTWLECTSNTVDYAMLGTSTENRYALLLTEEGGVLAATPKSKAVNNRFFVNTTVDLNEDGSGKTNTLFNSTGDFKEQMDYILNEKKEEQKEYVVFGFGFKQPDEFELSKKENAGMHSTLLEMNIEKVPEFIAGNKMFITPRLYKLWTQKLPKAENRSLDYYFHAPFEHVDTTKIKLPDGFTSDALPKSKELSCPYATFNTKYWYDAQQKTIYSTSSLILKQHRIPANEYAAVKKFFDEVLMDDTQRIVVKKE